MPQRELVIEQLKDHSEEVYLDLVACPPTEPYRITVSYPLTASCSLTVSRLPYGAIPPYCSMPPYCILPLTRVCPATIFAIVSLSRNI